MGDLKVEIDHYEQDEILDKPKEESYFLVPFFNFFYYFALSPFRIILDPKKGHYELNSCIFIKVCCGISHILVLVMYNYTVVMFFINMGDKEPTIVLAFELISNSFSVISTIIIMNLMWRRQKDFLRVIECTRFKVLTMRTGKVKVVGILVYAVLTVISMTMSAFNYNFIKDGTHVHAFLVNNNQSKNETWNESDKWRLQNKNILRWAVQILIMFTSIFYLSIEGILLVLTLSLAQLGKEFAKQMEKCQTESIETGINYYRNLQKSCGHIRSVFGDLILAYYVSAVSYYAEAPHVLLGKRGNMERLVLMYFLVSGIVWILAAEFHNFARKTLQNWIRFHTDRKTTSMEDRLQLLAISNEMNCDPISLSSKYFRVTYGHLGTMLGLIITYAMIVGQLYHDDDQ